MNSNIVSTEKFINTAFIISYIDELSTLGA